MENLIPKLRQTSIISKKTGFLSEELETFTSSNYTEFNIFFYLVMSTKGCAEILLFRLDLEL